MYYSFGLLSWHLDRSKKSWCELARLACACSMSVPSASACQVAVHDGHVPPRHLWNVYGQAFEGASFTTERTIVQTNAHPGGFLADFSRNEMRNTTALSQSGDDWETPVPA